MKLTQEKLFSILRVAFGIVWGIDAAFKWTPTFLNGLPSMISSMISTQPALITSWLNLWLKIINVDPHFFAVLQALAESALALGLIFNLFPKTVYISGFILSLVIWSVGEAFGAPYSPASTDIGTGIIYAFVFAALYFQKFSSNSMSKN